MPSASDFGGVGLLQTRTARFGPDGQLDVGVAVERIYRRYYITLQAVSWLEATFRYTDIRQVPTQDITESFRDRGADLKFKLLRERKYLPALALGIQDGLGTGEFAGEYLVASKRYFDLDFSLGIGWGDVGPRGNIKNPLTFLSNIFRTRKRDVGLGGRFGTGLYFRGERAALFGGIEYTTPFEGLSLKAEYEGNDYSQEPLVAFGNIVTVSSPFNYGFNYRLFPWLDLSAAYERGEAAVVRMSLRANLHDAGIPKLDAPPPPLKPRPAAGAETLAPRERALVENRERDSATAGAEYRVVYAPRPLQTNGEGAASTTEADAADHLFDALEAEGMVVDSVEVLGGEAKVIVSRGLRGVPEAAVRRAALSAANALSGTAEHIAIAQAGASGRIHEYSFTANELYRSAITDYLFDGLETESVDVLGIEFSHTEATLYVTHLPARKERAKAALIVLDTAPTAVETVSIVALDRDVETARVSLSRDEVKWRATVDRMFDDLETNGFGVESLDFSEHAVTVAVSTHQYKEEVAYHRAARIIAKSAATPVVDVTVVGLREGREEARVTLRADGARLREAGSGDEGEPPRTSEDPMKQIATRIFEELGAERMPADAVHFSRSTATVFVAPRRFRHYARNIGRVARVIANNAPASIEEISIVTMTGGVIVNRVSIMRADLERAVAHQGSSEEIWAHARFEGATGSIPDDAIRREGRYPGFRWSVTPSTRQYINDAAKFILYQVYAKASGALQIAPGLSVSTVVGLDIHNNFGKAVIVSDSVLPRVRSDIREYLQADTKLFQLQADYVFSPADDWFAKVSAGIFEEMFAGVGAEILYRPFGSRFMAGFDLNWVRQRDFLGRFGFQKYNVTTGHANFYYDLPFYDLVSSLHVGRYLAGDTGATYTLSRVFKSGVSVGLWATTTNVPPEEFGEGSFDKGFSIVLPLDLFFTTSGTRLGWTSFRPLARDGGQILTIGRLSAIGGGNLEGIAGDWHRILD